MAKILFYGRLSECSDTLDITLPKMIKTTSDLMVWLGSQNPALKKALEANGNRVAVNRTMISTSCIITDKDEIAFMSPLSGG